MSDAVGLATAPSFRLDGKRALVTGAGPGLFSCFQREERRRSECGPRRGTWIPRAPRRMLTRWYKAPGESRRNGAFNVRKISRRAQRGRTCWRYRKIASPASLTSGYC